MKGRNEGRGTEELVLAPNCIPSGPGVDPLTTPPCSR